MVLVFEHEFPLKNYSPSNSFLILETYLEILISGVNNHNYNRKLSKTTNSNTGFPVVDCDLAKEQKHHEFLLRVWNSNFLAPVESKLIGGDATAKAYPLSHFYGMDIITPKKNILSNVSFTQADVLDGLQYPNGYFDYIHVRDLLWYISTKDVRNKLFPDLLRVLKPGGWIESVEYDTVILNTGPNTHISHEKYDEVLDKVGDELIEYKTAFRSIRHIGKKLSV
ncbi:21950_t:CDS:2 [Cetraspora pellucida]|uniref:21950_t:CDS:1 n=1 Tax=Cetraspora pellucida TaxID=1433469 RepID=A0A9N9AX44_9GLOM|nr:21950_t:CDS:2 [Cetraspora pellucida]